MYSNMESIYKLEYILPEASGARSRPALLELAVFLAQSGLTSVVTRQPAKSEIETLLSLYLAVTKCQHL